MADKNQESKNEETKSSASEDKDETSSDESKAQSAISLLKNDHRKVEQLFDTYEKATTRQQKQQLAKQICNELMVHTLIEEEIFYPACRANTSDEAPLNEAQVEHDGAKVLIAELLRGAPGEDSYFDAKVKVLSEEIRHHVREEEKRGEGIFAKAKEAGIDTPELAQRLLSRKQALTQQAEAGSLGPPKTRSLRAKVQSENGFNEEDRMQRQNNTPDRDERGRFVSDDDYDRRSYGRGSSSSRGRGYYEDDDDDRRSSRGRGMPERDEYGRFVSEGENGYSRSSRSRYEDDDHISSRNGGRNRGWSGDSEGHAEASRRGWDERHGYSGDDDDYGRRSSRSSSGRSRYENDDDDGRSSRGRGRGGWFGDSEGHAEAAHRGWDERSGGYGRSHVDDDEYDRRASRSTRSSYDDDRRSSRSGGHRGWYGDSQGHSEAARKGWRDRD